MTVQYRDAYGLHASNGLLFNHESPRRGGTFVTRKITRAIAAICAGETDHVFLGNLDARRDWGYAKEYVEAMWLMLQQPAPDDFVVATGEKHSVRELCEVAFGMVDRDWQAHVRIDENYFRPTEVDVLCGDPSKAERILGWRARTRFTELVREMSVQTQFVLITHSKKTMSIAPVLYGVTMQEPGVSKLVSVKFQPMILQAPPPEREAQMVG